MPPSALTAGWPCPATHSLLHPVLCTCCFPTWNAHLPIPCPWTHYCLYLNSSSHVTWHRAGRSLIKELLVAGSPSEGAWTGHALDFGGTVCMCYLERPSSQSPHFSSNSDVPPPWSFPRVPRQSWTRGSHSSLCISVSNTSHVASWLPPGSSTNPCLMLTFNLPRVTH